jgi:hypothetical protein
MVKDVNYSITTALQFWEELVKVPKAKIKFKKKDGTDRIMLATLDFRLIPKKDHPKSVNLKKIFNLMKEHGVLHVYDLEKKAWRSVNFETADWLEIGDKRYSIRS